MKILYYSPHPHLNLMSPSGYGTHMREMIAAFENEGCEVLSVILGGSDNPPQEVVENNSSSYKNLLRKVVPQNLWRTAKDCSLLWFDRKTAADRLEEAIIKFQPDFIYERCNYLQLSGIEMAQKYGILHALEINSPYVEESNYLTKNRSYLENYAKKIEKKQVAGTDLAVVTVGPLKDYFYREYGADLSKFIITPNAFNRHKIQLNAHNQQEIRDHYQLNNKTVIGYIGSIFEWHGLDKLIEAFAELDLEGARLFIVGFGEYMVNLQTLTESLGLQEEVIFTGRVPKNEIFDYISVMDICAAPNAAWYQSPVKIFEYGAMGKPILGPDTAAVREVMVPEKDGILAKPTKEGAKEGLKKLLNNREYGIELGQHFQEKVLNEYTWKKNAQRILKAIHQIEARPVND